MVLTLTNFGGPATLSSGSFLTAEPRESPMTAAALVVSCALLGQSSDRYGSDQHSPVGGAGQAESSRSSQLIFDRSATQTGQSAPGADPSTTPTAPAAQPSSSPSSRPTRIQGNVPASPIGNQPAQANPAPINAGLRPLDEMSIKDGDKCEKGRRRKLLSPRHGDQLHRVLPVLRQSRNQPYLCAQCLRHRQDPNLPDFQ